MNIAEVESSRNDFVETPFDADVFTFRFFESMMVRLRFSDQSR